MNKIKAGIIGGAGYTAGELIRILLNHPLTEINYIQSESNAGNPVWEVHQDLYFLPDLRFTSDIRDESDVVFLCKGHGQSEEILKNGRLNDRARIIDLSQDFRISGSNTGLQEIYGAFAYGLPEMNKHEIVSSKNIANPGCFATSIQLGLLPLAKAGKIKSDVHVSAITGSTGAGQKLTETSHFTWRNNNMSVYKPFRHQHLKEIRQSLSALQKDFNSELLFIPYRGNFTRGIIATVYLKTDLSEKDAISLYEKYYEKEPFVSVAKENVHIKQVVNTNHCLLYLEKNNDYLMVISVIDNLIKGASGQAVQNMNIMFGLEETTGLQLKASAF